jgi:hypothetical protein
MTRARSSPFRTARFDRSERKVVQSIASIPELRQTILLLETTTEICLFDISLHQNAGSKYSVGRWLRNAAK